MPESYNTIFDDVFRTMMERMPSLVIPVINEVFHTDYPEDTPVEQYRNEHHTKSGEKITDSYLGIGDRLYHLECESRPSGNMCIRMIEYDFAIALGNADKTDDGYEIGFPDSCVLYLKHNSRTPDQLHVTVSFPDGQKCVYNVPVVKVQEYSYDEIFRKRLLFFLPFYVMRYEKQVTEIGRSPEKLNEFASEFTEIRRLLDRELETEQETETYTRLMELVKEVSDYILAPEPEAQERIGEIMGGKVLELETDRILARGIQRGIQQGSRNARTKAINAMTNLGISREAIMSQGYTAEEIDEALAEK